MAQNRISTDVVPDTRPLVSWKLLPAALLSASGVLLFGFDLPVPGYLTVVASILTAAFIDRALMKDLSLIALGLVIISTVPLHADLSTTHMALMGTVLVLAVVVPYLVSHRVFGDDSIRFPIRTGKRWSRLEVSYLAIVVFLGWAILPVYLISTGVYTNWPDPTVNADVFTRLFIGVNFVGIWDELFFICTTFTLLRKHFPDWQANMLQAVIFTSFLWEIGYQAWGPLLTYPFAMLQGYTFKLTKSLTYVVCVHLLFDLVLFLALVHAHNRDWLPIFVY